MTRAELLRRAAVGGAAVAVGARLARGQGARRPASTATSAPSCTTASSRAAWARSRAPPTCWSRGAWLSARW